MSYSLLEALRELNEDTWSEAASEIYSPDHFQIIKNIADKTRKGKNYIEYIKQNYDSKYTDPRSFVSKAALNNLNSIENMLADCCKNALPEKKYEDKFNDRFTIIKTNSKSELKYYGEGSWCCVCGRVRANSEAVRKGEYKAGDFVPGRSEHFLKHYYKDKNYSYYWYIVIDNDNQKKYYIGIDRSDGHVVEFRDKYDREVSVNQLPELNELKDYITKDFNKFKTSSKYKEIILESTKPYDPNAELDASNRYYADDSDYFSHTTETFAALVGILNKLDTRDLDNIKQNSFNLNVGRNGTVSITNQFIVGTDGKRLFPAPILRNPDKFKFGIVFKKDVLDGIDLENYDDFLNYWNHFDTEFDPTNQPKVKGSGYLRIVWIARTEDKAYLKIFMWPGILEISVDSYNKIKNYIRMQTDKSDSVKNLTGWNWKPNNIALGIESVSRGGNLQPSDFIEGCCYANGSSGPAITNLPEYKWEASDSRREEFIELTDKLNSFKNNLNKESKYYNEIIDILTLNKNVLYKTDLDNLIKGITKLIENNYMTEFNKSELLNIKKEAEAICNKLIANQRKRKNELTSKSGKEDKIRIFHVYLDNKQTKEIFDNFQVWENEQRANSSINFNDDSVVELCFPQYITFLDKKENVKHELNLMDTVNNNKLSDSESFNKLLNLLYRYLNNHQSIQLTFYDNKTLTKQSKENEKIVYVKQSNNNLWTWKRTLQYPTSNQINPNDYTSTTTTWKFESDKKDNADKALQLARECHWDYRKWNALLKYYKIITTKNNRTDSEVQYIPSRDTWTFHKSISNPTEEQINPTSYKNNITIWSFTNKDDKLVDKALQLAKDCNWNFKEWQKLLADNNMIGKTEDYPNVKYNAAIKKYVYNKIIRNPAPEQINPNSSPNSSYKDITTTWYFANKNEEKVKEASDLAKSINWRSYSEWQELLQKNNIANNALVKKVQINHNRIKDSYYFNKVFADPSKEQINPNQYYPAKNTTRWVYQNKDIKIVKKSLQLAQDCNWNYEKWVNLLKQNDLPAPRTQKKNKA